MAIKGVVFDFGGVLLSFEKVLKIWLELDAKYGLPRGTHAREITGPAFSIWLGVGKRMFAGEISVEEVEDGPFTKYLNEKYNVNIQDKYRPITACLVDRQNITFYKRVCALIPQLKKFGLKSALLTNNCFIDKDHKKQRLPYDTSVFDYVIESCLEGVLKPDRKIYEITQERMDLKQEEIVFIDDLLINCQAGDQIGWTTIQAKDEDSIVDGLEKVLGVKFDFSGL